MPHRDFFGLLLCIVLSLIVGQISGNLSSQEHQAMLDLRAAITPTIWDTNNDNACGWQGVTCFTEGSDDHVEILDLHFPEQFLGFLPPSISNLVYLKHLYLYNCTLSVPLPENTTFQMLTISHCNNVQFPTADPQPSVIRIDIGWSDIQAFPSSAIYPMLLVLNINEAPTLTKAIPEDLFTIASLRSVIITNTKVSGAIPRNIGSSSLATLLLNNNQLSGEIPPEIGSASALSYIDLRNNGLTGTLPSSMSRLPLETLDLTNNQFRGDLEMLRNISTLTYLLCRGNNFTGSIPISQNWSSLLVLDLADNSLSGTIPALQPFSKLQYLDLSWNQLVGSITQLEALSSVTKMYMSHNRLNGTLPNLQSLSKLQEFDAGWNQFTGSVPSFNSSVLNSIELSNNLLRGRIPDTFLPLIQLSYVGLANNSLYGWLPSSAFNRTFTLSIEGNTIGGCSASQVSLPYCRAAGNAFCCTNDGVPACSSYANTCLQCPTAAPSVTASCVYNEDFQLIWLVQGDFNPVNSTTVDGGVINGNVIIVTSITLNAVTIVGNLSVYNNLTVSDGVITVTGCTTINGSLILNLTRQEVDQLITNGTITRQLIIYNAACASSGDFIEIIVIGEAGCGSFTGVQQNSPGLISVLIQYTAKPCQVSNDPLSDPGSSAADVPGWGIALIVIGCLVVAAVVISVVLLTKRKNRRKSTARLRTITAAIPLVQVQPHKGIVQ